MIYQENRPQPSPRPRARLVTVAWSLLTVALLAALLFARQAEAASVPALASATSFSESEEVEFEEESEGEEEDEEEESEGEEDEGAGTEGPLLLPPKCLLHTAEAQVTTSASQGMVRLAIRYTSYAPASVGIDYWLKGSKGSLRLGAAKHHLSRQGTIHEAEHLGDHAMGKVLAARAFMVQLDVPAAPSFCDRYSTQRLTAKHAAGAGNTTWSRPR
jgi:hypothetical protein